MYIYFNLDKNINKNIILSLFKNFYRLKKLKKLNIESILKILLENEIGINGVSSLCENLHYLSNIISLNLGCILI